MDKEESSFERKEIVIPGQWIGEATRPVAPENTFIEGRNVYSAVIGLLYRNKKSFKVVPLKGRYLPRVGDIVIGKIIDVSPLMWVVDINSPYKGLLPYEKVSRERKKMFNHYEVGDVVLAKVEVFNYTSNPILSTKERGLGKLSEGRLVRISPAKIPRLIGRKGSMISMIKKETGSEIVIGKNGLVLVRGGNWEKENLVAEIIKKIERESHTTGLTNRIQELIREKMGLKGD